MVSWRKTSTPQEGPPNPTHPSSANGAGQYFTPAPNQDHALWDAKQLLQHSALAGCQSSAVHQLVSAMHPCAMARAAGRAQVTWPQPIAPHDCTNESPLPQQLSTRRPLHEWQVPHSHVLPSNTEQQLIPPETRRCKGSGSPRGIAVPAATWPPNDRHCSPPHRSQLGMCPLDNMLLRQATSAPLALGPL